MSTGLSTNKVFPRAHIRSGVVRRSLPRRRRLCVVSDAIAGRHRGPQSLNTHPPAAKADHAPPIFRPRRIPSSRRHPKPLEIAMLRRILVSLFVLSLVTSVAACSDTWQGAKQDTGDNLRSTGNKISK